MISTVALIAALSTGNKIGLAVVGVAFVVFALVSSFLLPRRWPDFPGRHVGLFVTVSILFFGAMLAAVLVFGKERKEASEPAALTQTQSGSLPGQTTSTTTAPTTTAPGPTTTAETTTSTVQGDPSAGKQVFASAGCSGCHTLKAAGASGNVGPNLDQKKPAYDKIVHQVEVGGGPMPAFKGQLSDAQIHDVAAFVYTSTH